MKKLSLILIIFMVSSCNFKRMRGNTTDSQEEIPFEGNPYSISYLDIQKQILTPSCLNCHSGRKEPNLSSFNLVKISLAQVAQSVLVTHTMPKKKPLSLSLQALLRAWIKVGAPEFATQPDSTPAPTASPSPTLPPLSRPVLFSDFKKRVLEPSCVSCHDAGNKEGLTSMEDYQSVMSVVVLLSPLMTGKIGTETIPEDQRMPPPKSEPLTPDQLNLLQMWLDDGSKP